MCFCSENVDFLYLGGHAWFPGVGACMATQGGGMHGCQWGGGHAWLPGGVRGCWGACMAAGGGMCGCRGACMAAGGHAWLLGGMRCCWGACMCSTAVGGGPFSYKLPPKLAISHNMAGICIMTQQ